MNQSEVLQYVVQTFERLAVPYMIVGSFAGYVYGEPRFTQDIDLVMDLPFFPALFDVAPFWRAVGVNPLFLA